MPFLFPRSLKPFFSYYHNHATFVIDINWPETKNSVELTGSRWNVSRLRNSIIENLFHFGTHDITELMSSFGLARAAVVRSKREILNTIKIELDKNDIRIRVELQHGSKSRQTAARGGSMPHFHVISRRRASIYFSMSGLRTNTVFWGDEWTVNSVSVVHLLGGPVR